VRLLRSIVLWSLILGGCAGEIPTAARPHPPTLQATSTFTSTITPSATSTARPSATPTSICTETSGTLEEITYPGYVSDGEMPVLVYLPPCYQFTTDSYPILYVLHGYPMDEMHWLDLDVVGVAEKGFIEETWNPFLIVMPRIPVSLNIYSDGGSGSYEEEVLLGLIPAVEEKYRVIGTEQYRAIAGVSRGGVWALEIGFRNSDIFNIVAALSPALHVNRPRPAYNPFQLITIEEELPANIFLSAAKDEGGFRSKTEELSQLMDTLGITHTFLLTDGLHEDSTWKGIMVDVLDFITTSWEGASQ